MAEPAGESEALAVAAQKVENQAGLTKRPLRSAVGVAGGLPNVHLPPSSQNLSSVQVPPSPELVMKPPPAPTGIIMTVNWAW